MQGEEISKPVTSESLQPLPARSGAKKASPKGASSASKETEPFNPAFDKRLMRRRWSQKEITGVFIDELKRNGKLAQTLREWIKTNGASL